MGSDGGKVQETLHSYWLWIRVVEEVARFEVDSQVCQTIHKRVLQVIDHNMPF